jgi:hypothetical protein
MSGEQPMAVDTRVVGFAASHLDGDHVSRAVVVHAARVGVEVDSTDNFLGIGIAHESNSIVAESHSSSVEFPWVGFIFPVHGIQEGKTRPNQEAGPESRAYMMRKFGYIALIAMMGTAGFAEKLVEPGTIQDLQPTNYAVAKKQHQQFDFSITTTSHSYGCRTPENKKLDATQFVVGSSVTFTANGRNGEVRSSTGKTAKCLITRVADNAPVAAPTQ